MMDLQYDIEYIILGMIAKYTRQVSIRQASASTPTGAPKSFSRQFSRQQSAQVAEKTDEEEV